MTITPGSPETVTVIGGVDTHKHTHYAAAVDDHGRLLGHPGRVLIDQVKVEVGEEGLTRATLDGFA
jgi:hypothetical protein